MSLVDFDFKMLRCSPNHRQRLAKIYKDVQSNETRGAAERRLHLLDLLTACSFDQGRGVYVPLSETVFLPGKLQRPPVKIESLTAPIDQHFPYIFFTNPLLLPLGYDAPDFEVEDAPAPKDRLTNAGFMVITLELDCERIEEFEQNLDWFAGKDGDFASAPFAALEGANHLADSDIYIIVTHLNPEHYAELNVVGQWLGIPNVIELYYRDQISQAVGRNKGFRDTGNGRKTVVIASSTLAQSGIFTSPALPATQPSGNELHAGWSEFRKKTVERIAWMMMDNEFAPRQAGHDHLRFDLTTGRLW